MKIAFMEWDSFGNPFIMAVMKKAGHEVISFPYPSGKEGTSMNEELAEKLAVFFMEEKPQLVFSFNFFPLVAMAAHACRLFYVSWIYDSPAVLTYSLSVFLPGNILFHFDSSEVGRLKAAGVENVFYMPLAAAEAYEDMVPRAAEHAQYDAPIAMIGSLYREEKFRIFRRFENFDEYTAGYLEGLKNMQEGLYGAFLLEEALTEDIMERVLSRVPLSKSDDSMATEAWTFANYYLAMDVTARERVRLLKELAKHFPVAVYTTGDISDIPGAVNRGGVAYYEKAPYAMKCAKINLNSSLRSIHTGVPLRVWDILGCGGFLLTNYQEDLLRHFVPDEDIVIYEDPEDAVRKAEYYLVHEDEREEIARRAHAKVRAEHGYEHRWHEMFQIITECMAKGTGQ